MAKVKLVASVCLYGNRSHGFDYLAELPDGSLWGRPSMRYGRWGSATACLMAFRADLRERGVSGGWVQVFAPCGEMVANHKLDGARPFYFGSLTWKSAAPAVTLTFEQVMAMAEPDEREVTR